MKKMPRISETEWELMRIVWSQGPCSAGQIIEALTRTDPTWHPRTVKAFLNRLVRKQALGFRKEGRAYLYRALVREEECVDAASESFLGRVFGGSLKPMLAHFVGRKKLSAADVRELKQLLEDQR
jgi:BlaI family transcriptional regulator, penicillinase repressor